MAIPIVCLIWGCALLSGLVNAADSTFTEAVPRVSKIESSVDIGKMVTITLVNEGIHSGRLVRIDSASNSLTLGLVSQNGISEAEIDVSQIDHLVFKKKGRIDPGMVMGGFILGGLLGHVIENQIVDRGGDVQSPLHNMTHRGAFWGAVSGIVVGCMLSLLKSTESKLSCGP